MMNAIQRPLPARLYARIFRELGALEAAGTPSADALRALSKSAGSSARLDRDKRDERLRDRAKRAASSVTGGQSVGTAGHRAGLFRAADARYISLAEEVGNLGRAYEGLALKYESLDRRSRRVRGQCLMPLFVLVLALLVTPLPGLIAGTIGAGQYVFGVLRPLVVLAVAIRLGLAIVRNARDEPRGRWGRWLGWITLRLPMLGAVNRRRNTAGFMSDLGEFLEAGLPLSLIHI